MTEPKYRRVLLKLSGQSLGGPEGMGLSDNVLQWLAGEIQGIHALGVEVGIVIGGGNIFRGATNEHPAIDRVQADHMGMLATIINSLALQNYLEKLDIATRVLTAVKMEEISEPFIRRRGIRHLEKGRIVIFGGGTGNPFFTTDTAAALRAMQMEADVILKGTRVDGVYDADPETNANAIRYPQLSYIDLVKKGLKVMDATAITMCMDHNIPIVVFNMMVKDNLKRTVLGENIGTIVEA
jgi:uridylate kinase